MTHNNIYFDLVRNTVGRIESWFSGTDSSEALYEKLMADFTADFSMITMGGTELGYPEISAFFKAHGKSKPGLQITLENMAIVYETSDGAVVTYLEIQHQTGQQPDKRLSTAVLVKDQNMQIRWKHLHETTAA